MKSAVRFAALNLPKVKETEAWKDITSTHKNVEDAVLAEEAVVNGRPGPRRGARSCVIL
jgi:hypothetical protein